MGGLAAGGEPGARGRTQSARTVTHEEVREMPVAEGPEFSSADEHPLKHQDRSTYRPPAYRRLNHGVHTRGKADTSYTEITVGYGPS